MNNRYSAQYNWYGEVHKMWTYAKTEQIAHEHFVRRLARLLGMSNYKLRCYFNGTLDNYKIKKENKTHG